MRSAGDSSNGRAPFASQWGRNGAPAGCPSTMKFLTEHWDLVALAIALVFFSAVLVIFS